MSLRSSLIRWSCRVGARRVARAGVGRTAAVVGRPVTAPFEVPALIRPSSLGVLQARLSSSDSGKCTEHDVESCSKCTKEVSLDELTALLEGGLRLVDVREAYELRDAGRIPNAVNIPLTQLKGIFSLDSEGFQQKTGLPKPTKADSIVFYGMGGIRSVAALEIACKLGFKKARHYPGGWQEWSQVHEERC